jgi:hypothetical protein
MWLQIKAWRQMPWSGLDNRGHINYLDDAQLEDEKSLEVKFGYRFHAARAGG